MAIIHDTTMSPGKLDLLKPWLPAQPWYAGQGLPPRLARAGGFRLDDPDGEVGIEFMIVTDGSGDQVTSYLVPMTYRASPLAGAGGALIGTGEHGVLGNRFVYDGLHDPVLAAQLVALIQGEVPAQAQRVSNTADPTVIVHPVEVGRGSLAEATVAGNDSSGTELRVRISAPDGEGNAPLIVRICRVLLPTASPAPEGSSVPGRPCVSAPWTLPDGTQVRGTLVTTR